MVPSLPRNPGSKHWGHLRFPLILQPESSPPDNIFIIFPTPCHSLYISVSINNIQAPTSTNHKYYRSSLKAPPLHHQAVFSKDLHCQTSLPTAKPALSGGFLFA